MNFVIMMCISRWFVLLLKKKMRRDSTRGKMRRRTLLLLLPVALLYMDRYTVADVEGDYSTREWRKELKRMMKRTQTERVRERRGKDSRSSTQCMQAMQKVWGKESFSSSLFSVLGHESRGRSWAEREATMRESDKRCSKQWEERGWRKRTQEGDHDWWNWRTVRWAIARNWVHICETERVPGRIPKSRAEECEKEEMETRQRRERWRFLTGHHHFEEMQVEHTTTTTRKKHLHFIPNVIYFHSPSRFISWLMPFFLSRKWVRQPNKLPAPLLYIMSTDCLSSLFLSSPSWRIKLRVIMREENEKESRG